MSLDLLQLEQNIEEGDQSFDDHEDDDDEVSKSDLI